MLATLKQTADFVEFFRLHGVKQTFKKGDFVIRPGDAPPGVFYIYQGLVSEYYGYIEQEKLSHMHDLNQLVGRGGTVNKSLLKNHNVIVVSDGLQTGFEVDLAAEFLKPVAINKLVVATPFASVPAVDRMHVLADDLYCLNVLHDYFDTDHYYDKQDVPDHETVLETIEHIIANWK